MKSIIIFASIFTTGLIVYWLLGAYFYWDLGWLSTMAELTEKDRVLRLAYYMIVQIICIIPYIPIMLKDTNN